jgi:hypothetical protein
MDLLQEKILNATRTAGESNYFFYKSSGIRFSTKPKKLPPCSHLQTQFKNGPNKQLTALKSAAMKACSAPMNIVIGSINI